MGQCYSKKLNKQKEAQQNQNTLVNAFSKSFPPYVITQNHRIRKLTGDVPTLQPISNSSILMRRTQSVTLFLHKSK